MRIRRRDPKTALKSILVGFLFIFVLVIITAAFQRFGLSDELAFFVAFILFFAGLVAWYVLSTKRILKEHNALTKDIINDLSENVKRLEAEFDELEKDIHDETIDGLKHELQSYFDQDKSSCPWRVLKDGTKFEKELSLELPGNHPLKRGVTAIARSDASDDVLFVSLTDYHLHLVHLTYSRTNTNGFPRQYIFKNTREFIRHIKQDF